MKILSILYCFPPMLVPAAICNLKMMIGLKDHGLDTEILTIDPDSFDGLKDETMNGLIPKDLTNHRIWSPENNLLYRLLKKKYRIFYRLFEPRKMEWFYPAIHFLKKKDLKEFDVILSCSQPHSNHLIGNYLKELTGKPWLACFSDPWTDNIYAKYHSPEVYDFNLRCEKKVMEKADYLFFTSAETVERVMKKYPGSIRKKTAILPHCFVPEWYPQGKNIKKSKIRIIQTGHFYGPRTPLPFFQAVNRLSHRRELTDNLEIIFYGNMEDKYKKYILENNLEKIVRINESIPYRQSLSKMTEADYLLLVDAPAEDGEKSVFLPSKLIDYLGSGKPVIGITPENGASAGVLKKTGNIFCQIGNEEEIYETLKNVALDRLPVRINKGEVEKYHYRKVTGSLVSLMQGLKHV